MKQKQEYEGKGAKIDSMLSIGIDIGATKANTGIVTDTGEILAAVKTPTGFGCDCRETIDRCMQSIRASMRNKGIDEKEIGFIGVGLPGTVDNEKGLAVYAPNLNWKDAPILHYLQAHFHCSMAMTQDTRAAALAEYHFGAGKGLSDMACIAIGTGVGCGLIINGKIYNGSLGTAGEFGHMLIQLDGKLCNCGQRGCIEAYASGRALNEEALAAGFADARALFEASKRGSAQAKEIVRRGIISIGTGVVNLVNLLSVEAVVFSGGLCSQEEYIEGIITFVREHAYSVLIQNKRFKLEVAKQKEDAPMIGAAILYKNK